MKFTFGNGELRIHSNRKTGELSATVFVEDQEVGGFDENGCIDLGRNMLQAFLHSTAPDPSTLLTAEQAKILGDIPERAPAYYEAFVQGERLEVRDSGYISRMNELRILIAVAASNLHLNPTAVMSVLFEVSARASIPEGTSRAEFLRNAELWYHSTELDLKGDPATVNAPGGGA